MYCCCDKMLRISVLLIFGLSYALGQTWESRGRVVDHTVYFTKLIQETIYEVEKQGFCNLKLDEFTAPINVSMFSWQIVGNVTYTNAFLLSIQKLDVTAMAQGVARRTIAGVQVPVASVRGVLHFRDSKYGYDVIFEELNHSIHRFTGIFGYTRTDIQLEVAKNLLTGEITTSASVNNLSGGYARMIYLPANNITEVLAREFSATTTSNGITKWATNTLAPIMLKVAQTKLDFPETCFNSIC